MKAVIFGGGNIGRGLVAPVLQRAGYEITVVDADEGLIQRLAEQQKFEVVHTAGDRETVAIHRAVRAQDEEAVVAAVAEADLVATAVGGSILPILAAPIRAGLNRNSRETVNVIACENTHPNSALLESLVGRGNLTRDRVGFPEVVVDRIVVPAEGLNVSVEPTFEFFVDGREWQGSNPPEGIQLVDDIDAYLTRKLWLVNGLHAVVAYQGLPRGFQFIHDAIADASIAADVGTIAANMVTILAQRHPQMSQQHLDATAAASLHRFADASIADPLTRVARNPLAKLGAGERILGPAIAAAEEGLPIEPHARSIAAALTVNRSATVEGAELLDQAIQSKGWMKLMEENGVAANSPLMAATAEAMESTEDTGGSLTETITIRNPSGLHARPASIIVEHVKSTGASVTIQKGDKTANAGSILSVLTLGASTGDEVTVTSEGEGAADAMTFIRDTLLSEEAE